jgi:hypothetical protein
MRCASRQLLPTIVVLAAMLVLAPAVAASCVIPIRTIGPLDGGRTQLVLPQLRTVTRDAWGVDESWVSTRPRLSQFVRIRRIGRFHAMSFRRQQSLSIDARGPFDYGWLYFDDGRPDTPACTMIGKEEWQRPRVLVRETATEVRIAAVTQRTVGDRTGCTLGPDHGEAECPNLTRVIRTLKRPVGTRRLVFEQFP